MVEKKSILSLPFERNTDNNILLCSDMAGANLLFKMLIFILVKQKKSSTFFFMDRFPCLASWGLLGAPGGFLVYTINKSQGR